MQREKTQECGLGFFSLWKYTCAPHYSFFSPSLLCGRGEHSYSELKTHLACGSVLSAWSTCSTDPAPPQKPAGAVSDGTKPREPNSRR